MKSFIQRKDAEAWSKQTELEFDRQVLPQDPSTLVFNAFLRHPICAKTLDELGQGDFAVYRDHRLLKVELRNWQRMMCPVQNLYEVAKDDWGLPS